MFVVSFGLLVWVEYNSKRKKEVGDTNITQIGNEGIVIGVVNKMNIRKQ
jgi:hypothetical protein